MLSSIWHLFQLHLPDIMFKSSMASAGVHKGTSTKLFYGSKSLKLWSVDDPDTKRMQFYRSPNWVIDNLLRTERVWCNMKGNKWQSFEVPYIQLKANRLCISIRHNECSQIMTLEKKSATNVFSVLIV